MTSLSGQPEFEPETSRIKDLSILFREFSLFNKVRKHLRTHINFF
jgi:hypothetical protein